MPDFGSPRSRAPERPELPAWIWLWLPPFMIVIVYITRLANRGFYHFFIDSEEGIVEVGTFVMLLPAIYLGLRCWMRRRVLPRWWIGPWLLLVTLACVYFAGEEVSWGQQFFQWRTPEVVSEYNDQGETNLHNVSSWFDQKPRLLLELWVLVGGIEVPISRRIRRVVLSEHDWRYWFWPAWMCMPAALLSYVAILPEWIRDIFRLPPFAIEVRYSEIQEFYFALFLCLYLASCWLRLKARNGSVLRTSSPA